MRVAAVAVGVVALTIFLLATTGREGETTHLLDVSLYGTWAGGHHLTSVLLHGLNAMLLFLALRALTDESLVEMARFQPANREEAKQRLMAKYPLSERQTDAILELRLYQLTGLERSKIEAEYLELMKLIEELQGILDDEGKLLSLIKKELVELRDKYASPRRTQIIADLESELGTPLFERLAHRAPARQLIRRPQWHPPKNARS